MDEHSYHIDFAAKAATYVETFMEAIRWENADRLPDELEAEGATKRRGRRPSCGKNL